MKTLIYTLFAFCFCNIYAQPNCEAFRYYYKDTLKYEACKKVKQTEGLYQFSKEYHKILDEAIKILERHINNQDSSIGSEEYLHLGVLYLGQKKFD